MARQTLFGKAPRNGKIVPHSDGVKLSTVGLAVIGTLPNLFLSRRLLPSGFASRMLRWFFLVQGAQEDGGGADDQ